jgi:Histidine kinase
MSKALQLLVETLRAWGWSHTAWAGFVGAVTLFANGTPLGGNGPDFNALNALTYNVLQFGFPLVLLLGWAHRLVDAQLLAPQLAYPLVVLVEVPLGVFVGGPLLAPLLGSVPWWTHWNDVVLAFTTMFWHALGVAVVAQRHVNQGAEARREAAEQAHAERARELAATELLALQARVDPPLLFERLQAIDAELGAQPARAGRRLVALIDLLRALQPHAQARESTLGRELDAVEAYARLISREAQGSERLHLAVPEALRELPMAPLVLLPLLRPLLAPSGLLWQLSGEAGRLQLSGLGPAREPLLAAARQVELPLLRQRLAAVLGASASLRLDEAGELPQFTLQWSP